MAGKWEPSELKVLRDTNLSVREVSRRTGRTPAAVQTKRHALGVYTRKLKADTVTSNGQLSPLDAAMAGIDRMIQEILVRRDTLGIQAQEIEEEMHELDNEITRLEDIKEELL